MNVDLAVLTPAYLDYTFVGLEALPGPGEERFAGDMLRSPGGGAITAVGANRLGLSTVLVAPLGDDLAGRFVRTALEEEGITCVEARGNRTPTTVVMPVDGERSMVTVDPGIRARTADLEPLTPRAIAVTLEQIDVVPAGACTFVTCGDDDARAFAGRLPRVAEAKRPRGLVVNRREACLLTGSDDPKEAAARLAPMAHIAAVTLGPDGVVAVVDGETVHVEGTRSAVIDTTGAGDLFSAALCWADLSGADPDVALVWANLYAGLSVRAHTGTGGAVTREQLVEEASNRGLPPLPEP